MKTYNILSGLLVVFSVLLIQISCTSQRPMTDTKRPEKVYTSLLDRLRDQPELTISGSDNSAIIRIRGNTSLVGDNEPLFVVNGNPVGNGYSSVSYSVDVNNVESIRVLTRSQSGLYGARGANGVILIKTK